MQPPAGAGPWARRLLRSPPQCPHLDDVSPRSAAPSALLPEPPPSMLKVAPHTGPWKGSASRRCRLPHAPTCSRRWPAGLAGPFQPGPRRALPHLGNEEHTPFPHVFRCFEEGRANFPLGRQNPSAPLPTPSSPPSHFPPFHSFALLDAAASPT